MNIVIDGNRMDESGQLDKSAPLIDGEKHWSLALVEPCSGNTRRLSL